MYSNVKSWMSKSFLSCIFYCWFQCVMIIFKSKNRVILSWEIFEFINICSSEAAQSLIISIKLSHSFLHWVLNFIFKLKILFISHLHVLFLLFSLILQIFNIIITNIWLLILDIFFFLLHLLFLLHQRFGKSQPVKSINQIFSISWDFF